MRLTSSVKELEVILQKLTKSEPGLILVNNDNEKHLVLMAMRITSDEVWARCNNGNNGSH
jgi:hypothetical protein